MPDKTGIIFEEEEETMTDRDKNEAHEEVEVERMEEAGERPYYSPLVDIYEEDDELVLVTDMPGVNAGGVEVTCENGMLTLNGHTETPPTGEGTVLHQEYVPGDYHRCFRLSEDIDVEKIRAKMSAGVLTLRLPKAARVRKRRI